MGKIGGRSGENREEKWGKRKEIYVNFQAICARAFIACLDLCSNLVSVHFYAIPKLFIYLYLYKMTCNISNDTRVLESIH